MSADYKAALRAAEFRLALDELVHTNIKNGTNIATMIVETGHQLWELNAILSEARLQQKAAAIAKEFKPATEADLNNLKIHLKPPGTC